MIQPFEGGAHPPTANQVSAVAVFAFVTCLLESLTDTTLLRFIQAISTAKLGHWVCLAVQIESHVWDGRVLLIHPPIDPRAFCPVATIRRLIDEASELAVHASSGTSTAMLGFMLNGASPNLHGNPWALTESLGMHADLSRKSSASYA
jgi:hypothetical protein